MTEIDGLKPWIIMRSHNDLPIIAETLAMLSKQDMPFELLVFDNASTDGTLEEVKKYTNRIINVPEGEYVPGRVLNKGLQESEGEIVVFLNADSIPQDEKWLRNLVMGFANERIAAVFGRQIPHAKHKLLHVKDVEYAYGDGLRQRQCRHCFSMASAAIRRSIWNEMKFSESMQYSEDIEWTWRARQNGYTIRYAKEAIVKHSHNYSVKEFYKRHYGEGKAEAFFFNLENWEQTFIRYSLLPFGRQVLSDWKYCARRFAVGSMFYSPILRMAQLMGRRRGFLVGVKNKIKEKRKEIAELKKKGIRRF